MESRSRRWSSSCAGDRPIPWIGVFLYCKMARAALSLSREPWVSVLPLTILFAVFTASSARPLDWGYATEDRLCFTPHVWRNSWNAVEVNGWPPSVLISSGVPYVWNSCRQMDINFDVVAWPGFRWYNMSQPVNLSAQARYVTCPTWNMSITICWNGHSGDGVMVMGSRGWLGAMVVQNEQFALKFRIEAFIPGQ